jgi:predicted nucleic acid-binding protein
LASLGVFAQYVRLLGSGARDIGEAATLAWAEVHGATAVLDDAAARRAGKERGVDVHGTLWLVANGLRSSLLTEDQAISLVDALRLAEAWLPCDGRGFLDWCRRERLL